MRIALVATGLDIGGAEMQVRDLAIGLKSRGHEVSVTSLLVPRALVDELEAHGVPIQHLGLVRSGRSVIGAFHAIFALRRLIRKAQPDIVHAHMVHANIATRLALAFTGSKVICTLHSMDEGGGARDLLYRLTNWGATINTTVSNAATRRFVSAGALPSDTRTVFNGIDLARFELRDRSAGDAAGFRWISVGRLEPEKDYPTLLRALVSLPDCHLTVVGDGSQNQNLRALVAELGLGERVAMLGARRDVPELFRHHDGFVLSSRTEGFGIVVAEAMASGLPVVATAAGGPVEIVGTDGQAGLIVPPADPAALAGAMRALMQLAPDKRQRVALAGQDRVRRLFSLEVVLDSWERLYAEILRR